MNVSLTTSCNAAKTAVFLWNLSPNLQLIAFQGGQLPCGGGGRRRQAEEEENMALYSLKYQKAKCRNFLF